MFSEYLTRPDIIQILSRLSLIYLLCLWVFRLKGQSAGCRQMQILAFGANIFVIKTLISIKEVFLFKLTIEEHFESY